ncbi:MAG TPA: hypothetical protein VGR22_07995 [Thermomicrobiales bacterium]|nr:hypothetical protein [Thermomicrobiales bacterium]
MRRRFTLPPHLRGLGEPIERFAQANIALVIVQAFIIRLSIALSIAETDEPDMAVLLGMLAAAAAAGALVVVLRRVIRRFPRRSTRIALALGSLAFQALAFQLIYSYAS